MTNYSVRERVALELGGPGRGLAPVGTPSLAKIGGHVVVHGPGRHHQPLRDLRVGQAGRDQPQDLQLAVGQPGRVGQRARLRPARQPGDAEVAQPPAHEGRRGCGAEAVEDRQRLEGRLDLARLRRARARARTGRPRCATRPRPPASRRAAPRRTAPGSPGRARPDSRAGAGSAAARRAGRACRAGRSARAAARVGPGPLVVAGQPGVLDVREADRDQPLEHVGRGRVAGPRARATPAASALPCRTSTRARIGTVSRPIMPGSSCPSSRSAQAGLGLRPLAAHQRAAGSRRAANM